MVIRNHSDQRGSLFVFDIKDVPFEVKRTFWVSGEGRGNHAHKKCKQLYVSVNGKTIIHLYKGNRDRFITIEEGQYLLVEPMIWTSELVQGTMLVLCSEEYDEKDYIRDFNQYLEEYGN